MTIGKKLVILLALFIAADVAIIGYLVTQARGMRQDAPVAAAVDPATLPILYPAPQFALTDNFGKPFSNADLEGKVWVAKFFFSSCAGPCPVMNAQMSGLALDLEDTETQFVSVTVDPETDTPERLMEHGERYGADFTRWHFLTGDIADITRMAYDGFKLGHQDDPIFHSDRFVLVDRKGMIRGYYQGTDRESVEELRGHVRALLTEPA